MNELKRMKKMKQYFGEGGPLAAEGMVQEGSSSQPGNKKVKKSSTALGSKRARDDEDDWEDADGEVEDELTGNFKGSSGGRAAPEHKTEKELVEEEEDLEYEDPYDDVYEDEAEEPESEERSSDYVTEGEDEDEEPGVMSEKKAPGMGNELPSKFLVKKLKKKKKDKVTPFVGTEKNLDQEEVLEFDNRAYDMLHRATTEYACLSCDFLTGHKADYKIYKRPEKQMTPTNYPMDVMAVAGSQASLPSKNQLYVLRFANLCQTKYDDDSEGGEDEGSELNEGNPIILQRSIPVKGGINRVRSMMGYPIVALWTEASQVKIYNVAEAMSQLQGVDLNKVDSSNSKGVLSEESSLLANFKFQNEGFGLEWSPVKVGRLLSGSVDGKVHIYESEDELCSGFTKLNHFYSYHADSVEDIQFSPVQEDVFATCSVDGNIMVADMRDKNFKAPKLTIKAHDCDVNVISWNTLTANLIASGADDGSIKVWDLRYPQEQPITNIKWHTDAITSIQWQPSDEWTLAASSADNRVSVWDFSVENNEQETNEEYGIPEQVIFLHHGQEDVKEVRWHPIYKDVLMTTAHSGFNVFKPAINEDAASEENSEDENALEILPTL
jgi:ribosome assembly protein RRB1